MSEARFRITVNEAEWYGLCLVWLPLVASLRIPDFKLSRHYLDSGDDFEESEQHFSCPLRILCVLKGLLCRAVRAVGSSHQLTASACSQEICLEAESLLSGWNRANTLVAVQGNCEM